MKEIKNGLYEKYFKRMFDFVLSLLALIILSPIILITALLVGIKLGFPVVFKQPRPGKNEKIFTMYKFRTMTNQKDECGNLLSDEVRLTRFGKVLRATSLDELLELINILKGDMSIVGPRPLLVRDMVFMTQRQRQRHNVRQGLTGLAQVNGRNSVAWEEKLEWDLKYVDNISFFGDLTIIFRTVGKVLKKEGINREGTVSDMDFGDYLLQKGEVSGEDYIRKQAEAKRIIKG